MMHNDHELRWCRVTQDAIVWHGDVIHVEDDVLHPVVLLGAESHGQENLAKWLGDSWVDALEQPRRRQAGLRNLQRSHQLSGNEVNARTSIDQHLADHDVVDDGCGH